MSSALREALCGIPLFAALSEEQLRWVLDHASEETREAGDVVFAEGEGATAFWILLEGELRITKRVGADETVLASHGPGAFTGEIPLLAGTPYIATARATGRSRLLRISDADFRALLARYPPLLTAVVRTMAERIDATESLVRQREKLAALGTMAAGLAHEMNNPASAARSAAGRLRATSADLHARALALGKSLDGGQLDRLVTLRQEVVARAKNAPPLDTLERSDREDELAAWLEDHGVEEGWELAPTLVSAALDTTWLGALAGEFPDGVLGEVLSWLGAVVDESELLAAVDAGTARVSTLVAAVKSYSYMDQAPLQDVDLHEGLENTLTILGYKLKKGVTVTRSYDRALPRLCAYGSELNQVWTNLIDNAVDAMDGKGRLSLRTARDGDDALVEIADDGPGIPPEALPRIFEPFFTTKGVGKGTGLGLDISYRIVVAHHHGDIAVQSEPGDTRFQVRIPLETRC